MANEKRLIDGYALLDAIEKTDWYHVSLQGNLAHGARSDIHTPLYKADDIYQALKDAPTVDAVEVVHGRWLDTDYKPDIYCKCSVCGHRVYAYDDGYNYCPNCGAKMDGGAEGGK